jgi:transcriptional regulator GlxA family with amidase domain
MCAWTNAKRCAKTIACSPAAAPAAAMDLLLHLIRRYGSLDLAQKCSHYLLIDNARSEQSVYVMWSMPKSHGDEGILKVQNWLEEHYHQPLSIDELAPRFGFGVRNFARRFKEATGYTPLAYLQTLRLESQAPAGVDPHESRRDYLQGGI